MRALILEMKRIIQEAKLLQEEATRLRRDFHKHPERGFCEFRTALKIIEYLKGLGLEVKYGAEVISKDNILGAPNLEMISSERARALDEGVPGELVDALSGGATAVVATINGTATGSPRTIAFRFDMDCNELTESDSEEHRPFREGFSSIHPGCTHACGHDGHVTIGLILARLLADNRERFSGKIKLIFQPAEEGVRGAAAMVAAGVVDDADYFFSGHLGLSANKRGKLACSTDGFLCASKFDAEFLGKSAHAGLAPQEGNNALLAASQAALSLHGISRHGGGASRINVGVIQGGSGRNVIPDYAKILFETRGENDGINAYMVENAQNIVKASAHIYGVESKMRCVGHASSFKPDIEFAEELYAVANETEIFDDLVLVANMNASEDCTAFMNRVTENGGKAANFLFGTELASPHHTPMFDINEDSLTDAAAFLAILALKYAN